MAVELQPIYSNRSSFYGKAKVEYRHEKTCQILYSYEKKVAYIENEVAEVFSVDSQTTQMHVVEFLKQNGLKATTKKQILEDYSVKEEEEEVW